MRRAAYGLPILSQLELKFHNYIYLYFDFQ